MTEEDIKQGIVDLINERRELKQDLLYTTGIEHFNTLERLNDVNDEIKNLKARLYGDNIIIDVIRS